MRRLAILALLIGGSVNAQMVTIDPQAYLTGTDLSSVTPGVTLSEVKNWGVASGYVTDPIYAVSNTFATGVGPNLFGHANGNPPLIEWDFRDLNSAQACIVGGSCTTTEFYNPLRAAFAAPTDYVEVRVQFPADELDGADLRAYNSLNQLIALCHVPGDTPTPTARPRYRSPSPLAPRPCGSRIRRYECNRTRSSCKTEYFAYINRAYPDIAYVLWGGESESATHAPISLIKFRRFSAACTP